MKIYEFQNGTVILDGAEGTLKTTAGDLVELRPQSREVLRLLATSPNRTVTKDEFTESVWEGRQVTEDSLVQCIAEIRTAIGDGKREFVQTVPRTGYRFIPPSETRPPPGRRISRPMVMAMVLLGIALAIGLASSLRTGGRERASVVAVLPLEDLSAAPNRGYLSDALSEGIISELARFPQFRVIARNSSFQFRSSPTDVRKIGSVLGAGYVVEGSQQFDGDRLLVTIQLVETNTGAHLFSHRYERELDDLFGVQNEIVRQVAMVVGQQVLNDMPRRGVPEDVDSRLRGLQARNMMTQLTYENWQKALALEETSIREEPGSAWGYIGKSLMLNNAAGLGWMKPRQDVLDESVRLAETALRLDPENYMSHYALARVLSERSEHARSLLHFQRAADLNPSDSIILIGMSVPLLRLGKTEAAIDILQEAAAVDPLHGDWLRWQLGWAYWQNDECDKGLDAMQSMASPPLASSKTLASLLVCLGRISDAKAALATFLDTRPGYSLNIEAENLPLDWQPAGIAERWMRDMKLSGMP